MPLYLQGLKIDTDKLSKAGLNPPKNYYDAIIQSVPRQQYLRTGLGIEGGKTCLMFVTKTGDDQNQLSQLAMPSFYEDKLVVLTPGVWGE
ncbi:hypothetical protein C0991_004400 [Blastosporella zonata]|nr:hypothetical protein C0991_004400 [Blastosporella zonata]